MLTPETLWTVIRIPVSNDLATTVVADKVF